MKLYVANTDTSKINELSFEFTSTDTKNFCDYIRTRMSEYYGKDMSSDSFTFFRKTDGRIFTVEKCNEIINDDYEIIGISRPITTKFNNSREAYLHFLSKLSKP